MRTFAPTSLTACRVQTPRMGTYERSDVLKLPLAPTGGELCLRRLLVYQHQGVCFGSLAGGKAAIVESEKTALIMSILCPGRVWLATGGKQNLKEAMLWPLVGMEVSLYPDADALADWYTRAMQLNRTLGTRLHIPTWYYDLMNHPEAKAAGWDLADVIISRGEFSPPY